MEKARRNHFHETAKLYGAHVRTSAYPAVQVAGCLVIVYVDKEGRLVISADFDDSEIGRGEQGTTDVVVKMNGQTVWETIGD